MCRGPAQTGVVSVIALLTATALTTACSSSSDSTESRGYNGGTVGSAGANPNQNAVGSVGLRLAIGTGVDVNSLEWTIANTSNTYSGTVLITDDAGVSAQSVEFVAGGVAVGSYTVSINGSDSNGDPCFGSTAPNAVLVSAGTISAATVLVTCTIPTDASVAADVFSGSVAIDAGVALVNQSPYPCPAISSFAINPAEVLPPQAAALSGVSTAGSSAGTETFLWTTSCAGALILYPASPNATFNCSSASGTCIVTLTVNLDGVSASGGDAGLVCPGTAGAPYYEQMSANVVCEPVDASVQGPGPEIAFVPVSDRVDMVHDAKRGLLYISTQSGALLEYDLAENFVIGQLALIGSLGGIDLSPSQDTLVVASGNGAIQVVDLTSGVNTRIELALVPGEGGSFTAAFIDDDTVLVSTGLFSYSGFFPLRLIQLSTGDVMQIATVSPNTMLTPSADRSVVAIAQADIVGAPFG